MIIFPSGSVPLDHGSTAAWLEARRKTLNASELGALFRRNGRPLEGTFASEYSIWWGKQPGASPQADNQMMICGRHIERAIGGIYAELYRAALTDLGRCTTVQHPDHPWLSATVDFVITDSADGRGLLEAKNVDLSKADLWEADRRAPDGYRVQAQVQIACTGLDWVDLVALIGGNRPVRVRVWRDDAFIAKIIRRGSEFMELVRSGVAPPVDGHPTTRAAQSERWPEHASANAAVVLPEETTELAWEGFRLRRELTDLDERMNRINATLMEHAKDARYAIVPGFDRMTITRRKNKNGWSCYPNYPRNEPRPERAEAMIKELSAA